MKRSEVLRESISKTESEIKLANLGLGQYLVLDLGDGQIKGLLCSWLLP